MFFFFNDSATPEIYTLSLHDALPISRLPAPAPARPDAPDRPRRAARRSAPGCASSGGPRRAFHRPTARTLGSRTPLADLANARLAPAPTGPGTQRHPAPRPTPGRA